MAEKDIVTKFVVSQNEKCSCNSEELEKDEPRANFCFFFFFLVSANQFGKFSSAATLQNTIAFVVQFTSKYLNLFSRNFNKFSELFEAFIFYRQVIT